MTATARPAWICPVCGYIHYGDQPPEECPICGTLGDQFEAYREEIPAEPVPQTIQTQIVVIAGAGIAGVSAAEALRKAAPQAEIVLVSEENELPYYRLNLTRYLAGEVGADQLTLHPESWYREQRIQLQLGCALNGLDATKKELTFQDGSCLAYDRLILATGAHPFVPPFPGAERRNVTTLRTRLDADFLLTESRASGECICIGGGLLGLETAGGLARRGVQVTVLENMPWLLPRQLNAAAASRLQAHLLTLGISVRTAARTRQLVGDRTVRGVELEGGECLPAGLVVISAGVRSNLALAQKGGLGVRQGIQVDDALRTSHAEIFAAGDAAEHGGTLYGTWAPAQIQGAVAGLSAAGQPAVFRPLPRSNTLKVLGIDLFSIGQIEPTGPADQVVEGGQDGKYAFFLFREDRLAGAILLGDAGPAARVKQWVEDCLPCETLLRPGMGAAEIMAELRN